MKTRYRLILLLLLAVPLAMPAAQDTIRIGGFHGADPWQEHDDAPVLLALSGGGARGLASIGVLRAFEEKGITVAAIAGTSIGGIVGGLYSCGYTPEQLENISRSLDFNTFFTNKPARLTMFLTQRQERDRHLLSVRFNGLSPYIPQGLTAGQRLTTLLSRLTANANYHAGGDFTRLPIPFKAITTDIVSGKMVVVDRGSLADAMRASMAFPLAFTGVQTDNQILMDGGMVAPVPVEQVKQLCDTVSTIVAVNTTSPLLPKELLNNPVDIANQVTTIMTADQLTDQLRRADYVITPPLEAYSSADFLAKDSIIAIGYRAGVAAADSILHLVAQQRDTTRYHIASVIAQTRFDFLADTLRQTFAKSSFTRHELVHRLKTAVRDLGLFELDATVEPAMLAGDSASVDSLSYQLVLHPKTNLIAPQTRIEIEGNSIYSDSLLIARMELATDTITFPDLRSGLDRIVNQYHVDGWDLADIRTVQVDHETHRVRVQIDEGIVRRIDVDNNKVTRDWVVRAYMPLKVGQPYSTRAAGEGLTNIYATDLFDRVSIMPEADGNGAIVKIMVDEKKYNQARLGWHWDDEYQSEQFVEILNDNLMGIGAEYLVHLQYGNDHQYYAGELKANRIFQTYLTTQLVLFHDRLDRAVFDSKQDEVSVREENMSGGSFRVGQQIERFGMVTSGLLVKEVEIKDNRTAATEKYGIRAVSLESLVENFDRWPFPQTGKRHLLELQIAGKFLGGDAEFTRFFSSLESYFPLGKYLSYHPRLSVGLSRRGLPPTEQFYIGGLHSLSGYRTHQLAGDKTVLLNNELRAKLPLRLYLTVRYDVGEVYTTSDEIKLRNLRHGFGASAALDLPIGPIEFGYGIADHNIDRFYFTAGLAF